jgi:hypothetical protein
MHEELVVVLLSGASQFLDGCHLKSLRNSACRPPAGSVKHAVLVTGKERLKVLIVAVLFEQDVE